MAVLKKVAPVSVKEKQQATDESLDVNEEKVKKRENEDDIPQHQRKKPRRDGYREDPFVFFGDEEPVWDDIKSFYEISNRLIQNVC